MKKRLRRNKVSDLKIGVIGLGYVGLPLAVELGKKYSTIGYDIDEKRIIELKDGFDITSELSNNQIKRSKNLYFTNDSEKLIPCNIYIITVPTPVNKHNQPDMTALKSATILVAGAINRGDIVIYESTVYPGATEEFCVPIIEKYSKLTYNKEFSCGYSPERINPGDKQHTLTRIKKITSGTNKKTLNIIDDIYNSIIPAGTHRAPSIAVAEAAKVIENIQRDVNIALINELAILFDKLNLDTQEILQAAETKWNFQSFKPGLVGGHCIGVDPYYLTYKAKTIGYHPNIILSGRKINEGMGKFIADKTINKMKKSGINPKQARIGIFGITFKENCSDMRNTKVPDIINNLLDYGCKIDVTDPYANKQDAKKYYDIELINENKMSLYDTLIVTTAHNSYKKMGIKKWKNFLNKNGVFIDVKGIKTKKSFLNTNIRYWKL
ncbi:MAG: Vi polysaccharide biosynthesis protein VipA/TviB [Candidatus Marinimicrobia bacterium]|nr:Vi polysaccharide biosynthesis protein VipA/TviB [Candidatus Neomarinimicrobiota bacterium]